jgi:hypothetical protein
MGCLSHVGLDSHVASTAAVGIGSLYLYVLCFLLHASCALPAPIPPLSPSFPFLRGFKVLTKFTTHTKFFIYIYIYIKSEILLEKKKKKKTRLSQLMTHHQIILSYTNQSCFLLDYVIQLFDYIKLKISLKISKN